MHFPERTITLKDGRTCVLRPNGPDLADQMLEYLKKTSGETEFLIRNEDEVNDTLEDIAAFLGRGLENPYNIAMAAVVDGKLAGVARVFGIGAQRKLRHRCSLAIALYKEYWGLGIGTALINYQVELATQVGWDQMDLEVVAENEQAQVLYKKRGFIETGRRHNAMRFDDGTYHDEILMYRDLKA